MPGEMAEKHIAKLYGLAKNFEFGTFRDELI